MIVLIPKSYEHVVKGLERDTKNFYSVKASGDHYELKLLTTLAFSRLSMALTRREFAKFCRDIRVIGGSKKKTEENVVFFPKRPVRVTVRLSEEEAALIRRTAAVKGVPVADFVRFAALSEALTQETE